MKTKLKTYLVTLTFLFLATFLWQCEKEVVENQEQSEKTNFEINSVKISDILGMSSHLDRNLNKNFISKNSESNAAIFDVNNVIEVIDTLQNTNYSISFTFPEAPLGTFYNLVVGKDALGVLKIPYVLRYTSNPASYQAFEDSGFNMDYFTGTINMHKYTDYFESGEFSRTSDTYCPPDFDENGDPIPCEASNVNGSGNGSGDSGTSDGSNNSNGSSGPYNGSGYGGGSSSCPFSILIYREERPCSACPSGTGWFTVVTYVYDCGGVRTNTSRTSDDCPDCNVNDGGVGVNAPRLVTILISQLNITDQDIIDWVENPDNLDDVELVNQWLRDNGATLENEAFANLALEALEDGVINNFEEFEQIYIPIDNKCQGNNIMKFIAKTDASIVNSRANAFKLFSFKTITFD